MKLENVLLERIREFDFNQLNDIDIGLWITEEIQELARDSSIKIENEDLFYLVNKLKYLFRTRFNKWGPAKVHIIFQKGLSGDYGSWQRLNYKTLYGWINQEIRNRGENYHQGNSEQEDKGFDHYNEAYKSSGMFIHWLVANDVDYPESFTNNQQDEFHKQKRLTPDFLKYCNLFHQHRKNSDLDSFKKTLPQRGNILSEYFK